jgi:hypothetical protein
VFHVQTESIERSAPLVQTLIYSGGEVLVRMTAPLTRIVEQAKLADDDVQRALRLQHWALVRKIQRGMLEDEPSERVAPSDDAPQSGPGVTPAALASLAEPSVEQVLDDLRRRIGEVQRSQPAGAGMRSNAPRSWLERMTPRVSLVVRW